MITGLLLILSAVLFSLSFSSFNLWLFAWCALVPLFIALEGKTLWRSLAVAYVSGIIFWSLTLYWLVHVTLLGQIILILFLALYFAIFGGVFYLSRFASVYLRLIILSTSWVLIEYLRSYLFTGFPWAIAGLSQYRNLAIIQIANITGAWGVSFLIVLTNVAIYLAWRKRAGLKILISVTLILGLVLIYGYGQLNLKPVLGAQEKSFKVTVIQGNIPQHLKWNYQAVNFILNSYRDLTQNASSKDHADLIIWPEASVPGLWGQDDDLYAQVFSLAAAAKTNLLVGAVSYQNQNYFNSALLINAQGSLQGRYSKLHLVPFGEYIPLKNIFPFLETIAPIGDITAGTEYTVFKQPHNFGVLICFEDLFPELSREFIRRGGKFLVNITNDAWYKEGSAAYQHFAASVFRAVENRVYLARAANTGISGFIDPAGRVLGIVRNSAGKEIFVQGYSSQSIPSAPLPRTIYNRYGDFFVALCLLFNLGIIVIVLRKVK